MGEWYELDEFVKIILWKHFSQKGEKENLTSDVNRPKKLDLKSNDWEVGSSVGQVFVFRSALSIGEILLLE